MSLPKRTRNLEKARTWRKISIKYKEIPILMEYIKRESPSIYKAIGQIEDLEHKIQGCKDSFNADIRVTNRGLNEILGSNNNKVSYKEKTYTSSIGIEILFEANEAENKLHVIIEAWAYVLGIELEKYNRMFTLDRSQYNKTIFSVE